MKRIRSSSFYKVKNKNKHAKADEYYMFCTTGTLKFLFTKEDMQEANERAKKNPVDTSFYEQIVDDDYYVSRIEDLESKVHYLKDLNEIIKKENENLVSGSSVLIILCLLLTGWVSKLVSNNGVWW